ncbi:MAG: Veg protein [Clostridiaceae bacterium]|nr:Veg protein [Clostridiaceae bacterium]
MIEKDDLFRIKKSLESNIGKRVRLTAKKGRKKSVIRQGIIESTYPSIFVIKLDNDSEITRRVSYSYTDVLTKTVELVVCGGNEITQCS